MLLDRVVPIGLGQMLVPFTSSYRPLAVGLGVTAAELMAAVGLTNLVRKQLPHTVWRRAHYLTLAPHNVGGPVATAANVHFAVATRNVDIVEHFNDFADAWLSELVDIAPAVDPLDGCFAVPDRPGLGVRLDHEACARHPRTSARLRLFTPGWQKRQGA